MTVDQGQPLSPSDDSAGSSAPRPLRESAEAALQHFLSQLDGQPTTELYAMVMAQVEEPLLAQVMDFTQGNQSKAADMLGLNRGTLRKKLRQYGLLEPTDNPTSP